MNAFRSNRYTLFRKAVTLAVAAAFFLNYVLADAWAAVDAAKPPYAINDAGAAAGMNAVLDVETFSIPAHMGEIRNSYRGDGGRIVIHLQDAHCNVFAQRKISEIIDYLHKEYGVSILNLEGGAGDYDLSIFTAITGEEIRAEVAEYFVEKGEVNGAELYAINNPGSVQLWGIEDKGLYVSNLKVYRDSLSYRPEVDKYLKELGASLDNLKRHIYTPELLKIDEEYISYKSGRTGFREYLEFMAARAKELKIDLANFKNIDLLAKAMAMEGAVDFRKANKERDELVTELQGGLSKNEIRELVTKTVDFKAARLSRKDFYTYLLKKAAALGLNGNKYPALSAYVAYITDYESVDRASVMNELAGLEAAINEKLYTNNDQRELAVLSKNLALANNIFGITLTKTDYKYFLDHKNSFKAENYVKFIRAQAPRFKMQVALSDGVAKLDSYLDEIMKFYVYSFERDRAFLKNMKFERLPGGGEGSVLVTGGFHAENLCDLFEKDKISYISIIPKFTSTEGYKSPYFDILAGETMNVQSMLKSVIAQASMLQIASHLNSLGDDVWGKANMYAFRAAVKIQALIREEGKNVEIVDARGNTLKTPDGKPLLFGEKGDVAPLQLTIEQLLSAVGYTAEAGAPSFSGFSSDMAAAGYRNSEELVKKSVADGNLVGVGGNAKVYSIPGMDGYVLRVMNAYSGDASKAGELRKTADPFPGINVGQAVAQIGEGISVLKEQLGVPAGVPYGPVRSKKGEEADRLYDEHLKRAAEMPQSAYDALAEALRTINAAGYQFDPSKANNILVDSVSGKFNLVDISRGSYVSTFADMVVALMDNAYAWQYKGSVTHAEWNKAILEKCFAAAKKAGLPVPGENDSSLAYSFELAGMKDKWPEYRARLFVAAPETPLYTLAGGTNSVLKGIFGILHEPGHLLAYLLLVGMTRAEFFKALREAFQGQFTPPAEIKSGWKATVVALAGPGLTLGLALVLGYFGFPAIAMVMSGTMPGIGSIGVVLSAVIASLAAYDVAANTVGFMSDVVSGKDVTDLARAMRFVMTGEVRQGTYRTAAVATARKIEISESTLILEEALKNAPGTAMEKFNKVMGEFNKEYRDLELKLKFGEDWMKKSQKDEIKARMGVLEEILTFSSKTRSFGDLVTNEEVSKFFKTVNRITDLKTLLDMAGYSEDEARAYVYLLVKGQTDIKKTIDRNLLRVLAPDFSLMEGQVRVNASSYLFDFFSLKDVSPQFLEAFVEFRKTTKFNESSGHLSETTGMGRSRRLDLYEILKSLKQKNADLKALKTVDDITAVFARELAELEIKWTQDPAMREKFGLRKFVYDPFMRNFDAANIANMSIDELLALYGKTDKFSVYHGFKENSPKVNSVLETGDLTPSLLLMEDPNEKKGYPIATFAVHTSVNIPIYNLEIGFWAPLGSITQNVPFQNFDPAMKPSHLYGNDWATGGMTPVPLKLGVLVVPDYLSVKNAKDALSKAEKAGDKYWIEKNQARVEKSLMIQKLVDQGYRVFFYQMAKNEDMYHISNGVEQMLRKHAKFLRNDRNRVDEKKLKEVMSAPDRMPDEIKIGGELAYSHFVEAPENIRNIVNITGVTRNMNGWKGVNNTSGQGIYFKVVERGTGPILNTLADTRNAALNLLMRGMHESGHIIAYLFFYGAKGLNWGKVWRDLKNGQFEPPAGVVETGWRGRAIALAGPGFTLGIGVALGMFGLLSIVQLMMGGMPVLWGAGLVVSAFFSSLASYDFYGNFKARANEISDFAQAAVLYSGTRINDLVLRDMAGPGEETIGDKLRKANLPDDKLAEMIKYFEQKLGKTWDEIQRMTVDQVMSALGAGIAKSAEPISPYKFLPTDYSKLIIPGVSAINDVYKKFKIDIAQFGIGGQFGIGKGGDPGNLLNHLVNDFLSMIKVSAPSAELIADIRSMVKDEFFGQIRNVGDFEDLLTKMEARTKEILSVHGTAAQREDRIKAVLVRLARWGANLELVDVALMEGFPEKPRAPTFAIATRALAGLGDITKIDMTVRGMYEELAKRGIEGFKIKVLIFGEDEGKMEILTKDLREKYSGLELVYVKGMGKKINPGEKAIDDVDILITLVRPVSEVLNIPEISKNTGKQKIPRVCLTLGEYDSMVPPNPRIRAAALFEIKTGFADDSIGFFTNPFTQGLYEQVSAMTPEERSRARKDTLLDSYVEIMLQRSKSAIIERFRSEHAGRAPAEEEMAEEVLRAEAELRQRLESDPMLQGVLDQADAASRWGVVYMHHDSIRYLEALDRYQRNISGKPESATVFTFFGDKNRENASVDEFLELKRKAEEKGMEVEFYDLSTDPEGTLSKLSEAGVWGRPVIRVVNLGMRSLEANIRMMAMSDLPLGTTGDESLLTAITLRRPVFYEVMSWKRNLFNAMLQRIRELGGRGPLAAGAVDAFSRGTIDDDVAAIFAPGSPERETFTEFGDSIMQRSLYAGLVPRLLNHMAAIEFFDEMCDKYPLDEEAAEESMLIKLYDLVPHGESTIEQLGVKSMIATYAAGLSLKPATIDTLKTTYSTDFLNTPLGTMADLAKAKYFEAPLAALAGAGKNKFEEQFALYPDIIKMDQFKAETINFKIFMPAIFKVMNRFYPKLKPVGITGALAFFAAVGAAIVLGMFGIVSPDTFLDLIQGAGKGGALMMILGLIARLYLGSIQNGNRMDRAYLGLDPASGLGATVLLLRVFDSFRPRPGTAAPTILIANDIHDMDADDFKQTIMARKDMTDTEKMAAISEFNASGKWFGTDMVPMVGLVRDVLFIKGMADLFPGNTIIRDRSYANNALYNAPTNTIYVHKYAAMSTEFGFGLVMAHERGKRAFFQNRFFSRFFGTVTAELFGMAYETAFIVGYPFTRIPGAFNSGTRGAMISALLIAPLGIFSLSATVLVACAGLSMVFSYLLGLYGNVIRPWQGTLRAPGVVLSNLVMASVVLSSPFSLSTGSAGIFAVIGLMIPLIAKAYANLNALRQWAGTTARNALSQTQAAGRSFVSRALSNARRLMLPTLFAIMMLFSMSLRESEVAPPTFETRVVVTQTTPPQTGQLSPEEKQSLRSELNALFDELTKYYDRQDAGEVLTEKEQAAMDSVKNRRDEVFDRLFLEPPAAPGTPLHTLAGGRNSVLRAIFGMLHEPGHMIAYLIVAGMSRAEFLKALREMFSGQFTPPRELESGWKSTVVALAGPGLTLGLALVLGYFGILPVIGMVMAGVMPGTGSIATIVMAVIGSLAAYDAAANLVGGVADIVSGKNVSDLARVWRFALTGEIRQGTYRTVAVRAEAPSIEDLRGILTPDAMKKLEERTARMSSFDAEAVIMMLNEVIPVLDRRMTGKKISTETRESVLTSAALSLGAIMPYEDREKLTGMLLSGGIYALADLCRAAEDVASKLGALPQAENLGKLVINLILRQEATEAVRAMSAIVESMGRYGIDVLGDQALFDVVRNAIVSSEDAALTVAELKNTWDRMLASGVAGMSYTDMKAFKDYVGYVINSALNLYKPTFVGDSAIKEVVVLGEFSPKLVSVAVRSGNFEKAMSLYSELISYFPNAPDIVRMSIAEYFVALDPGTNGIETSELTTKLIALFMQAGAQPLFAYNYIVNMRIGLEDAVRSRSFNTLDSMTREVYDGLSEFRRELDLYGSKDPNRHMLDMIRAVLGQGYGTGEINRALLEPRTMTALAHFCSTITSPLFYNTASGEAKFKEVIRTLSSRKVDDIIKTTESLIALDEALKSTDSGDAVKDAKFRGRLLGVMTDDPNTLNDPAIMAMVNERTAALAAASADQRGVMAKEARINIARDLFARAKANPAKRVIAGSYDVFYAWTVASEGSGSEEAFNEIKGVILSGSSEPLRVDALKMLVNSAPEKFTQEIIAMYKDANDGLKTIIVQILWSLTPRDIARELKVDIKLAFYLKETGNFERILSDPDFRSKINEIARHVNREKVGGIAERRLSEDDKVSLFNYLFTGENIIKADEVFLGYFWNDPSTYMIGIESLSKILESFGSVEEAEAVISRMQDNPRDSAAIIETSLRKNGVITEGNSLIYITRKVNDLLWRTYNTSSVETALDRIKPIIKALSAREGYTIRDVLEFLKNDIAKNHNYAKLLAVAARNDIPIEDVLLLRLELMTQNNKENLIAEVYESLDLVPVESNMKRRLEKDKDAIIKAIDGLLGAMPAPAQERVYFRAVSSLFRHAADNELLFRMLEELNASGKLTAETLGEGIFAGRGSLAEFLQKTDFVKHALGNIELLDLINSLKIKNKSPLDVFRQIFMKDRSRAEDTRKMIDEGDLDDDTKKALLRLLSLTGLPWTETKIPHIFVEPLLRLNAGSATLITMRQLIEAFDATKMSLGTRAAYKRRLYDKMGIFSRSDHPEAYKLFAMIFAAVREKHGSPDAKNAAALMEDLIVSLGDIARAADALMKIEKGLYPGEVSTEISVAGNAVVSRMLGFVPKSQAEIRQGAAPLLNDAATQKSLADLRVLLAKEEAYTLFAQLSEKLDMDEEAIRLGLKAEAEALGIKPGRLLLDKIRRYAAGDAAFTWTDYEGNNIYRMIETFLKGMDQEKGSWKMDQETFDTMEKDINRGILDALMAEIDHKFSTWKYQSPDYIATVKEIIDTQAEQSFAGDDLAAFNTAMSKAEGDTPYKKLLGLEGYDSLKGSVRKIVETWESDIRYEMADGSTVEFVGDFYKLITAGHTKEWESCQDLTYHDPIRIGLTGYVANGTIKIMTIYDQTGMPVTRRVVRLVNMRDETDPQRPLRQYIFVEESTQFGIKSIDTIYNVLDLISERAGIRVVGSQFMPAVSEKVAAGEKRDMTIKVNRGRAGGVSYSDRFGRFVKDVVISGLYRMTEDAQEIYLNNLMLKPEARGAAETLKNKGLTEIPANETGVEKALREAVARTAGANIEVRSLLVNFFGDIFGGRLKIFDYAIKLLAAGATFFHELGHIAAAKLAGVDVEWTWKGLFTGKVTAERAPPVVSFGGVASNLLIAALSAAFLIYSGQPLSSLTSLLFLYIAAVNISGIMAEVIGLPFGIGDLAEARKAAAAEKAAAERPAVTPEIPAVPAAPVVTPETPVVPAVTPEVPIIAPAAIPAARASGAGEVRLKMLPGTIPYDQIDESGKWSEAMEQLGMARVLLEEIPKEQLLAALRDISGNKKLVWDMLSRDVRISYQAEGTHKHVFRADFYDKDGKNIKLILAVKKEKAQGDISSHEIQNLKKLKGRGVPMFGGQFKDKEGRTWFLEEFIEGETIDSLKESGKLTDGIKKKMLANLLMITMLLGGMSPRDIHGGNFIVKEGTGEMVMVDIGERRLYITGKSASKKHMVLFLSTLLAQLGSRADPAANDFLFEAIEGDPAFKGKGLEFLRTVSEEMLKTGSDRLGEMYYSEGRTLFPDFGVNREDKKALVDFADVIISGLNGYLAMAEARRGPPAGPVAVTGISEAIEFDSSFEMTKEIDDKVLEALKMKEADPAAAARMLQEAMKAYEVLLMDNYTKPSLANAISRNRFIAQGQLLSLDKGPAGRGIDESVDAAGKVLDQAGIKPGAKVVSVGAGTDYAYLASNGGQMRVSRVSWENQALARGADVTMYEPAAAQNEGWQKFSSSRSGPGTVKVMPQESARFNESTLENGSVDAVVMMSVLSADDIGDNVRRDIVMTAAEKLRAGGTLVVGWYNRENGEKERTDRYLDMLRERGYRLTRVAEGSEAARDSYSRNWTAYKVEPPAAPAAPIGVKAVTEAPRTKAEEQRAAQVGAAVATVQDQRGGKRLDIIRTMTSETTMSAKASVDTAAGRKFRRDYGSDTLVKGYLYDPSYSPAVMENNFRGAFEEDILTMLDPARAEDDTRAIYYVTDEMYEVARGVRDGMISAELNEKLKLRNLSPEQIRAAAERIVIIKGSEMPESGLVDEIMHVVSGKRLIEVERYRKGVYGAGVKMGAEERMRIVAYLNALDPNIRLDDPNVLEDILDGKVAFKIQPVNFNEVTEWRESQDAVLRSL